MSQETYRDWIRAYEARCGGPSGTYARCAEATTEMVEAFPELLRVPGHVNCPFPWGRRAHWWCVTAEGEIVDPTKGQFPGIYSYDPFKEGDEVRLGKCMNCGDEIWGPIGPPSCICSKQCGLEMEAEFNAIKDELG